jgi:branched-chain amino acid transport system substrate-binding protein
MDRRSFLKTAGAGLALGASGVLSGPAFAQENVITFGGSIPATGAAAETGLNVKFGYDCAVKFINEKMGGAEINGKKYKLALNLFDDASDPSRATSLIQKQVDEGVSFFLGSFGSNIVLPTCAITEAAGRIMVQAGGGSDLIFTQGRRRVFGLFPRASRQFASTTAMFKTLNPQPASIMFIYTNDAFSKVSAAGARQEVEAAGYKVLDSIALPAQVSDVTDTLGTVRAANPDVLVCSTHDDTSILIARQMVATNTNVKLLFQTLGPQTAAYKEALGKYANSVMGASYWDENAAYKGEIFGSAKGFATYYRENFKRQLTYHMASGAACIVAYVEAMKKAKTVTDRNAIRDTLAALDIETFYARIKFTPQGDGDPELLGPMVIQRQKGEVTVVYPKDAASTPIVYPAPAWKDRT